MEFVEIYSNTSETSNMRIIPGSGALKLKPNTKDWFEGCWATPFTIILKR